MEVAGERDDAGGTSAKCPRLPDGYRFSDDALPLRLLDFAGKLRAIGIDSLFGLELRAAQFYEEEGNIRTDRTRPSLRRYFYRPAVEPLLYANRADLAPDRVTHASVDTFMSLLRGHPITRREVSSRSIPDAEGRFASYPAPDYARLYLERIAAEAKRATGPIERAFYVFAEAITSHPYTDGNGRLARALMFASLAHDLDLDFIDLPWGPVTSAHADRYMAGLEAMSFDGNWTEYMTMMADLVTEGIDIASRKLRI